MNNYLPTYNTQSTRLSINISIIGKDSDAGRDWGRRTRGRQRMRWLDGIIHLMDVRLSELWELVMHREAWRAGFMGSQRVRHDGATELRRFCFLFPNQRNG